MMSKSLICTLLFVVIVNKVQSTDSSCPSHVRKGCYHLQNSNLIYREINEVINYKKFLLRFTCDCAKAVKQKSSEKNEFKGFALRTDWGRTWFCYGRTASQIEITKKKEAERSVGCYADYYGDQCNSQDKTCVGIAEKSGGAEFLYEFKKEIDSLNCGRYYSKFGCYDKRAKKEDLLIFDRYNIKWDDISAYIHDLACRCDAAAREANKGRHENRYVGFALHYFGECYGRTKKDFDDFRLKEESSRCIGDQSYTICKDEHKECVGRSFSEYVYRLK